VILSRLSVEWGPGAVPKAGEGGELVDENRSLGGLLSQLD